MAVQLKFGENMVGRGRGVMRFEVVVLAHGMLHRLDRDRRGLDGDEAHGRDGPAPGVPGMVRKRGCRFWDEIMP
jgi:hypothetical protein